MKFIWAIYEKLIKVDLEKASDFEQKYTPQVISYGNLSVFSIYLRSLWHIPLVMVHQTRRLITEPK